jgi:2-desacetyl-2-hydroxyethyl bacteriochlorophyllide A dehydrogenase
MRALLYDGKLRLENNLPVPTPTDDQVLLKIRQAGICNTDLELIAGYMNFSGIPGHEFVAEVVSGPELLVGARVVGEINVVDGTCDMCLRGMYTQCRNRTTLGISQHPGAFSEYLALSARNLHRVSDRICDKCAVFTEPLAAAMQMLEAIQINPRDRVIVLGAGKLGLLCAQVLKLTGANLAVVVRREKPAQLLSKWGIPAISREEVDDHRAQIVVDCTGHPDGFADALNLVEARGTILMKSTYQGTPKADLTQIVVNELRVIGSRCGPFDAALRLLEAEAIDVESLIEAEYSLNDGIEAFAHAARQGALKVLLKM